MRNDFMMAINQVCAERKLSREVVLAAVEAALISAYKRNFGAVTDITVLIDPNTGAARVFAEKEVVAQPADPKTQISLDEARQIRPEADFGQFVPVENTPRDFGALLPKPPSRSSYSASVKPSATPSIPPMRTAPARSLTAPSRARTCRAAT